MFAEFIISGRNSDKNAINGDIFASRFKLNTINTLEGEVTAWKSYNYGVKFRIEMCKAMATNSILEERGLKLKLHINLTSDIMLFTKAVVYVSMYSKKRYCAHQVNITKIPISSIYYCIYLSI